MNWFLDWGIYVVAGLIGILAGTILIANRLRKNWKNKKKLDKNLVMSGGERFTVESNIVGEDGSQNLTYTKKDVLLAVNTNYNVGKGSDKLAPGKYILLSSSDKEPTFNMRIGGLVREYKHGQEVVLAEDDVIAAVSIPVILR